MPLRRQKTPKRDELKDRAQDIKEKAVILAEESKPALKDFSATTSTAAKEFATTAFQAAKELMEVVEKAGDRLEKQAAPARRRGRKMLKATIALGVGAALFSNDKVKTLLKAKMGSGEPEPWNPPSNGEFKPAQPESKLTP